MKTIAIIGAGPAGIEAAALLARQGYQVDLFEKSASPLQNLKDKAFLFPNFAEAREVADRLAQKLDSPLIHLHTNSGVDQRHSKPNSRHRASRCT